MMNLNYMKYFDDNISKEYYDYLIKKLDIQKFREEQSLLETPDRNYKEICYFKNIVLKENSLIKLNTLYASRENSIKTCVFEIYHFRFEISYKNQCMNLKFNNSRKDFKSLILLLSFEEIWNEISKEKEILSFENFQINK